MTRRAELVIDMSHGMSRTPEMLVGRRGEPVLVREHRGIASTAKIVADDHLTGDLRPAAEPEAALLAGLEEVVEEADQAEPDHHAEHEHGDHRPGTPASRCPIR